MSARECGRCGSLTLLSVGAVDDQPPFGGALAVDTVQECGGCGHTLAAPPLLTPAVVARRVERVTAHRRVCDGHCPPGAPCRASRPGMPAVALKAVAA